MNRLAKRVLTALLPSLVAVAAFGQLWPVPSKIQNTEVSCTVGPCSGKKTVGYTAPITTFTGRILDSQATNDYQQTFRTGRAIKMVMSPDGRRMYMIIGSMAAAYDSASFFTRLASGEVLMPWQGVPLSVFNQRPSGGESFLRPDRFFYAEDPSTGWSCPHVDGQQRLNDMDVDDQGYVYLSYYVFGWGIVKDDLHTDLSLGQMSSVFQFTNSDPGGILSFKDGSKYYVLVSTTTTEVWQVAGDHAGATIDRTSPLKVVSSLPTKFSIGAKNSAGDRIALIDGATGKVNIYTGAGLAAGGSPVATFSIPAPYQYDQITSDGTNFYATYNHGNLKVDTFVPSGSTYVQNAEYDTGFAVFAGTMRAGSGYLTIDSSSGLLTYKIGQNLGLTEVPMLSSYAVAQHANGSHNLSDGFFQQYFFNPPTLAYSAPPFYVHPAEASIIKSGTKNYIVFLAVGLADVYELQSADGITVTNQGASGTQNSNTPLPQRTQTYYGDPIGLTATTTAPAPMNITWNFGNAEAVSGADLNTAPPPAGAAQTGLGTVKHRYSGIGTSAGLTPRTVTVTNNADSSIFGQASVTMLPPAARIGVTGSTSLFTTTTTTSQLPIVAGDKWFDASDGTVESHSSSWSLYTGPPPPTGTPVTSSLTPLQQLDVGVCGPHYMSFTGHYGQNGTLLPATDYTVPSGGLGVGYSVLPFVAKAKHNPPPGPAVFTSLSRLSSDPAISPLLSGLQYHWDLLNANGTVNMTTTPATYVDPVTWNPSATNSNVTYLQGMKVRLTLTSSASLPGTCAGLTTSTFDVLTNPPDPVIGGGCTSGQMPCTFTVTSASGVDMVADGWTYSWSIPGLTGSQAATYTPALTASGHYTVSLTASNVFSNPLAPTTVTFPFDVTVQVCQTYRPNVDIFVSYAGLSSGCTAVVGNCTANETVSFKADTFNYNLACAPHTYAWSFGDGGHGTGLTPTHQYSAGGTYTVTCDVTDSSTNTTQTLSHQLTVGQVVIVDPCNPPGLSASTVFITFTNNTGTCTNVGGTCAASETINFAASTFGYNFGCTTHSFSWTFGDNSTSTSQAPTHAYAANGTYPVTLSIVGGNNTSLQLSATVNVGTVTHNCDTMVANRNVFVSATDTSGTTCGASGATCLAGHDVIFSAASLGYNFGCATHTYSWNFGDGSGTVTGSPVTHSFASPNTYNVTVTIGNGSQTLPVPAAVVIGGSSGQAVNSVDFTITPFFLNGNPVLNGYTFHPVSDPSGAVTTWSWNFGDGICPGAGDSACTSTGDINHVFTNSNNYSVTLSVKAPTGVGATAVHSIKSTPVVVDFSMTPYSLNGVEIPNAYLFHPTADPTGSVTAWNWNFGDGTCPSAGDTVCASSNGDSLHGDQIHLFANANNYVVTLSVKAPSGVPATAVHTILPPSSRHRAAGH